MNNILFYETKKDEELAEKLTKQGFEEDIFEAFEPGETLEPSSSRRTIAVAWCVELKRPLHAEEVIPSQRENPGKELTFRCPECHVGLRFVLAYEGVHARMCFIEQGEKKDANFMSLSQQGTKDHRYCLMRVVETKWLPGASQERLSEIMSFRRFEKIFAQLQEQKNAMALSLIQLENVIEAFKSSFSSLDQKSSASISLGYMIEFEDRAQKKKRELQQQLYHLCDAYKDFRHEIRGY